MIIKLYFAGIGQRIVENVQFEKPCIVERYYKRKIDFSIHRGGDIFINLNNNRGRFGGLAFTKSGRFSILSSFEDKIRESVKRISHVMPENYDFSVDMFLYEQKGEVCLHPLVEINMRKTMNIIGRRLKHFAEDKIGVWSLKERVSENAIQLAPEFAEKSYLQFVSEDEFIKCL